MKVVQIKKQIFFSLFLFFTYLLSSCASNLPLENTFNMSEEQYEDIVEAYTDHSQKYDGPYNILEVSATLVNSQVIDAQLKRQATLFQWDTQKYQTEFESKKGAIKDKTEVFISFFTPDKKSGDLLRSNTLWKILLKSNGRELAGTPKKMTLLPVEIISLYPRHNRWSTAYMVTFEAPLANIEMQPSELIITGPVGVASLHFQPLKNK